MLIIVFIDILSLLLPAIVPHLTYFVALLPLNSSISTSPWRSDVLYAV